MSDAIIAKLVDRLEAVTKRLESIEGKVGAGGGAAASSGGSGGDGEQSNSVLAYDDLSKEKLAKFTEASNKIGGDCAEGAALFVAAAAELRRLLVVAADSKQPSDADLPAVLKPLSTKIQEMVAFRDAKGKPSPHFDHLSTMSEGVNCFAWVSIKPAPGPFVANTRPGSEFYSNKLLKKARDDGDDNLKTFVQSINGLLKGLEGYIKDNHRTGLTYGGQGDAKAAIGSGSAAAPAAAKPAAAAAKPAAAKPAAGKPAAPGGLFAELNVGNKGAAGFGLKKVDKSQMTHKNPELRKAGAVPAAAATAKKPVRRGVPNVPKKIELQGTKWVIEGTDGDKEIIIEPTETKQTIYVYGCFDSVIQVKGKCTQVAIDSSKKVSLVCTEVVSGIEVVNSGSVNLQILNSAPTVTIDKVSSAQVYMSPTDLATQIVTAKSDAINVFVPKGDGDFTEVPIAEQFITKVGEDGKVTTQPLKHEG